MTDKSTDLTAPKPRQIITDEMIEAAARLALKMEEAKKQEAKAAKAAKAQAKGSARSLHCPRSPSRMKPASASGFRACSAALRRSLSSLVGRL
jgi:hypothetical protein